MKKFIAAFDGLDFCESTMQYAIFLATQCNAHLVGVFLEDFARRSYSAKELASYQASEMEAMVHILDERDTEERRESIEAFEKACLAAGVRYSIHRDRNVALQELLEESIYADLLVISAAQSMSEVKEHAPSRFVKDLLIDVQCPVILVPPAYEPFERIVLLYDGELSSVYAVKSFSYLFDNLKHLRTEVLTVKEQDATAHLPHNRLIKEFIRRHYPNAEYMLLIGDPEDEIVRYLKQEKISQMLVLGSYRRSKLSRLFRPTMADQLLHHLKMPLFIAHHKS